MQRDMEKRRESQRRYYAANREKKRRYYENNKGKVSKRNKENRSKLREYYRFWRYGLSAEDVAKMLADQGGVCGVCGEAMKKPYVDHCHKTNKVRGLVHSKCNAGIGMLGDDIEGVLRAARYLVRFMNQ